MKQAAAITYRVEEARRHRSADALRAVADKRETLAAAEEDDAACAYLVGQMDALRWAAALLDGDDPGELPTMSEVLR